ncbi:FliO/MopB family protein [Treponema sp. R6D11]
MILLAAGFLIQIQYAYAQEEPAVQDDPLLVAQRAYTFDETDETPAAQTGSSVWPVIRMILVLAFTAAAIYGVVYFLKRSSRQAVSKSPFLKILATAHLGVNRYAHIVSVGSKAWLLGSSDGGVNLIGEVEDKEIIDAMLLEESKSTSETQGRFTDFISMLRRLGLPAQSKAPSVDDIRKRRERFKGL